MKDNQPTAANNNAEEMNLPNETGAAQNEPVPEAPAPTPEEQEATSPLLQEDPQDSSSDFEKMMEAYEQKIGDVRKGSIVEGKIVKIQDDNVLVDIGTRCEGIFPTEEIRDENGDLKFAEGDTIQVQVQSSTASDFAIKLSHKNAKQYEQIRELKKHYQDGTPVEGVITHSVKGGMKVDISGVEAFLPASQIETRYVENTDDYAGLKSSFRIMKFNPRQNKLVVSRRVLLEEEREKLKAELWENLEVGQVVKGMVTRLTGYGVFVDLGGMEGLVHISNLSWDKVKKPSELVKVGEEIETQVIELDRERERIGLGLKQMVEDPWLTVDERYFVGQKVEGIVEKLESFGAFVKLEPGVTALIPISEMSWTRRVNHPSELMARGDSVEAVVLRVDPDERKISLSLKQITPSPFSAFVENHRVGEEMEGEITNVVGYGAFVRLDEGVEGLLHISELSWSPVQNIDDAVKAGDKIQVRIININPNEERISLSAKVGEPPAGAFENAGEGSRPARGPREGGPRRGGRKGPRKDREEDQYILNEAPSSSTKLGELFPQQLLEKMKSKKEE